MPLDVSALKKAITSLSDAIHYAHHLPSNIQPDIVRDSVIQRFEYTYELAWKLLQRWIKNNLSPEEADPRTKKDLFRVAAKKSMIDDPESWFTFSETRNDTVHTYNEKNAEHVYNVTLQFLPKAILLLEALETHND